MKIRTRGSWKRQVVAVLMVAGVVVLPTQRAAATFRAGNGRIRARLLAPSDRRPFRTSASATRTRLFTNRRWGSVAAALAVVMAFARVYVGAHYPGDVLAGLALGAAVAAVGRLVAVPQLTRLAAWLSRTSVRPILTNTPHSTQPL